MTDPRDAGEERELAYRELLELHASIDAACEGLVGRHRARLVCERGCSACCCDELTVFEIEAERIRRQYPAVLGEEPAPAGGCAFLDPSGSCRVYGARPYVCRTQGLPLAWFEQRGDSVVQLRTICELNAAGPPVEELEDDALWLLGPCEERLAALQARFGIPDKRSALRDLFRPWEAEGGRQGPCMGTRRPPEEGGA